METELNEIGNDSSGIFVSALPEESFPALVPLDFIESGDAVEIDRGIRESIRGIRLSILAMGLGLAKIKENSLYKYLGCNSLTQYIQRLSDETKMDRSNIFSWLRIGEAYIRYKSDLEQIGFSDSDGPTKLSYLNRALEKNEKEEVFGNIKNMSLREFKSFSKGQTMNDTFTGNRWVVTIRGNSIHVNNKLAVITSKKIEPRVSSYFKEVLAIACEALEKEGMIVPVFVRNRRDARRFKEAVYRLKAQMGMK